MKYWEYSKEEIIEQKLYPLLSLQVFKLRYEMEKIKNRKTYIEQELRELIREAQQIVEDISVEAVRLFQAEEIDGEYLHKILLANAELFRYLNSRYLKDEKLNEEVLSMAKTLYDPVVEERGILRGKREIARKLLQKKMSIGEIKEITDLSDKEIEKIRRQMEN